ncbi:MAG: hypothetical protein AAFY19_10080 [Pseudomonadota bacterium]
MSASLTSNRRGLHATFSTAAKPDAALREAVALMPDDLSVLPMAHRPAKRGDRRWNATLIALGTDDALDHASDRLLASQSDYLMRLAIMDVQEGIDMLYAKSDGLTLEPRMIQFVEYVFSQPAERDDYYACQYDTSAPAMRSLWEKGLVGRFLGFENPQLLYSATDFPNWDVLHLIGMTPWQMLRFMPRVNAAFDQFAEKAGRGTRKAVAKKWDRQRELIKLTARQL